MEKETIHKTLAKKLIDKFHSFKCSICYDVLENVRELSCKHVFCVGCLDMYKEKNHAFVCPVCKVEIPKRKILSRDMAVDSFCAFLSQLSKDVQSHYDCDLLDILPPEKRSSSLETENEDIIQLSSEENDFVPASVPATGKSSSKKTPKKNILRKTFLKTPKAKKTKATEPKKTNVLHDKKIEKPPDKSSEPSVSKNKFEPVFSEQDIFYTPENKVRIVRWLHDTKNQFERISQTQQSTFEKFSEEDIDLPSVSQMIKKTYKRSNEKEKTKVESIPVKRAQSLDDIAPSDYKALDRHSVECSSPSRMKQYQNLDRLESKENKNLIALMEDEVLDVIDKEVSGEGGKKKQTNKEPSKGQEIKIIELIEDEALNAIDRQVSEIPVRKSIRISRPKRQNIEKNPEPNISKTGEISSFMEKVEYKKVDKSDNGKLNDEFLLNSLPSTSKVTKETSWPSFNKFKRSYGKKSRTAKIMKNSKTPSKQKLENEEGTNEKKSEFKASVDSKNINDTERPPKQKRKDKEETNMVNIKKSEFEGLFDGLSKDTKNIKDTEALPNQKREDKKKTIELNRKKNYSETLLGAISKATKHIKVSPELMQEKQNDPSDATQNIKTSETPPKQKQEDHNEETILPSEKSPAAKIDFDKMEEYFTKIIPKLIENNIATSSVDKSASLLENSLSHPRAKIDFDRMEEYFTRVIPMLIENNIPPSSQDNSASFLEKTLTKPVSNENDIDIYIQSTQPLSGNTPSPKNTGTDVLHYAKKLQSLLIPQTERDVIDENVLSEVFPIIKQIFETLCKHKGENTSSIPGLFSICSDKEIQTDSFYREFFNIPSTSFQKILHGDVGIQTDNCCENCPHIVDNSKETNVRKIASFEDMTADSWHSKSADELSQKVVRVIDLLEEKMNLPCERPNAKTQNDPSVPQESELPIEEILKRCNTQNDSVINVEHEEQIVKTSENESTTNENDSMEIDEVDLKNSQVNSSQGSKIICSLPSLKSRVNRKLMFEKAMKEREETLKKIPSMDSNDGNICNRFLNDDLSIQFETESQNFTEEVKVKARTETAPVQSNLIPSNSGKQNIQQTQVETQLLDYCEELIEKANQKITPKREGEIKHSPKPVENKTDVQKSQTQKFTQINNHDLLKHCDELIEMENKKIEQEKEGKKYNIKYSSSQLPSTSKIIEYEGVNDSKNDLGTQALLEHCNALIEKENTNSFDKVELQEEMINDEMLCRNLDELEHASKDSSVKPEIRNSISFHGKTQEEHLEDEQLNDSFDKVCEAISFPSQKRKHSIDTDDPNKRIKILQNVCLQNKPSSNDFNSSDDEMFEDVDVIESTPQKQENSVFLERLSCSQALNTNSRRSNIEHSMGIPIVPPPPGFDDSDDSEPEVTAITQIESENVIPNSLSPEKMAVLPMRKALGSFNSNVGNSQNIPPLSQEFKGLSPIRKGDKKNLNVIELVQRSKSSPLTILPKDPPIRSPLTSTPKQKSILSYVTPKVLSQKKDSEGSCSQKPKSKPCIAFTRLDPSETALVLSLCIRNLATCQKVFGPDVTHMIVSVDKNNYVKDYTIKLVSAIAAGIWVLNIKWIEQCLGQNTIVDEEPYEVLDISGIPSPRISRLTRLTNPLFKGFKFHISPPFSNATVQDLENVVKLLGGSVASSIKDVVNSKEICIVISEALMTEDYDRFEEFLEKYKVVTVDMNWLSMCVCRYTILSMKGYIIYQEDSLENLGYPDALLVDVPLSINEETENM